MIFHRHQEPAKTPSTSLILTIKRRSTQHQTTRKSHRWIISIISSATRLFPSTFRTKAIDILLSYPWKNGIIWIQTILNLMMIETHWNNKSMINMTNTTDDTTQSWRNIRHTKSSRSHNSSNSNNRYAITLQLFDKRRFLQLILSF